MKHLRSINEINKWWSKDMDNNLSDIESILDDYLDGIGHIFKFEMKHLDEDIFLSISGSLIENIFTNGYQRRDLINPCPIIEYLDEFYNQNQKLNPTTSIFNTNPNSGKNSTIENINNTPLFQRIFKLTGFKLTFFRSQRDPSIILELSKKL